ncbi:hypothetical protein PDESU_06301 [Pontiella desulfatans]|uniref:SGNH hydrolase-type esterase domain-containing protein n=2 Tax=Pontiella desulfatans TaxID=2750659 RepID=A0A6C2UCR8_PONDE|nr:hypothetical protein PDESU_06301 [Pontiella desulfatans]
MKPVLNKVLIAGAALSISTAFGDQPRTVTPERQNEWWHARHEEKLAEISNRGDQIDLVFIGDSITHFIDSYAPGLVQQVFPGIQHLNLGYSADKTENVLWRLRNGELAGISPQVVVIMIGTNNTGHRQDSAAVTGEAIGLIVQEVRQQLPDAQVILHSIFPRGEGPTDGLRMLNEEINALLPAIAAGDEKIIHMDINSEFLDQDGILSTSIMPDLLHPNAAGYDIWMTAIEPVADQYLIPSFEPTISWDGEAGDGLWSSVTNWTGDRLPGATDIVGIGDVTVNYDVTDGGGNLPSACIIQLSNATLNATTVLRMTSSSIHVGSNSTVTGSGWWDLNGGSFVFEDGAAVTMNNWEQKGLNTFTFNLSASGFTTLTPGALRIGNDGVHGASISNATYVVDMTNYTGGAGTITLMDFGTDGANMDNATFQSATMIVTNAGAYQASIQWNDSTEAIELSIAGTPPPDPDAVSWDGEAGDGLWTSATNWLGDVEPTYGDDVVINNAAVNWDVTTNAGSFLPDSLTLTGSATLTANTVTRFNGTEVNVGPQAALAGTSFYDFNSSTARFEAGATATMTWWEQKGSPTFVFNLNAAGFTVLTPGNLLSSTGMSNVTYVVDMANYTGVAQDITLVDFTNGGSLTAAGFQTANLVVQNAGSYTANLVWDDASDSIVLEMDGSNPGIDYDVSWDGGGGADSNWLTAANWDNDSGTGNGDVVHIGSSYTANWNFGGGWHSPGNPAVVDLDGSLTASDAVRSWSTVWNISSQASLDLGANWLVLWGGGSAFIFDAGATLSTSGNIQFGNHADCTLGFNLDADGFDALNAYGLVVDGFAGQTISVDMADYTGSDSVITLVDFSSGGAMTAADFQNFSLIVTNTGSYQASLQWNETTADIELAIEGDDSGGGGDDPGYVPTNGVAVLVVQSASGGAGSTPVDLSADGDLDWGAWDGELTVPGETMAGGAGFASLSAIGATTFDGGFFNSQNSYSWTNGTPTATGSTTLAGNATITSVGDGVQLAIDVAAAGAYQLKFYTTTYDVNLDATVTLASGGVSDMAPGTYATNSTIKYEYTVDFSTDGSDTLTLDLVKSGGANSIFAYEAFSLKSVAYVPDMVDDLGKILCIGDSITEADALRAAGDGNWSWRYPFWKKLVDAGISHEFVGTRTANYQGTSVYPDYNGQSFTNRHEAIWGLTAQERAGSAPTYLGALKSQGDTPDTAVIFCGGNDVSVDANVAAETVRDRIKTIVDHLQGDVGTSGNSDIRILLVSILPRFSGTTPLAQNTRHEEINDLLGSLATNETTATSYVTYLDISDLFNTPPGLLYDGVHPNGAGEEVEADEIFDALVLDTGTGTGTTYEITFINVDRSETVEIAGVGEVAVPPPGVDTAYKMFTGWPTVLPATANTTYQALFDIKPAPNGEYVDVFIATGQSNAYYPLNPDNSGQYAFGQGIQAALSASGYFSNPTVVIAAEPGVPIAYWWAEFINPPGPNTRYNMHFFDTTGTGPEGQLEAKINEIIANGDTPRFMGVFWWQGESDGIGDYASADTSQADYELRWNGILNQLTADLGAAGVNSNDFSFVVNTVSESGDKINNILTGIANADSRGAVFDTQVAPYFDQDIIVEPQYGNLHDYDHYAVGQANAQLFIASFGGTVDPSANQAPSAQDQTVAMGDASSISITLSATDPEDDPLSYSIIDQPTNGTLSGTAPNLTYTPNAGWNGRDTFTFTAQDVFNTSSVATITITDGKVVDLFIATGQSNAYWPLGTNSTGTYQFGYGVQDALDASGLFLNPAVVIDGAPGQEIAAWHTGTAPNGLYNQQFFDTTGVSTGKLEAAILQIITNGDVPRFRGLFWFQGETDGQNGSEAQYANRWNGLLGQLASDLNALDIATNEFQFVMNTVGNSGALINSTLTTITDADARGALFNTQVTPYRTNFNDIHGYGHYAVGEANVQLYINSFGGSIRPVDIFIVAGQSNANGQGLVSELTAQQAGPHDARFYCSWHYQAYNAETDQYFSGWQNQTVAGQTRSSFHTSSTFGGSSWFGPEIGFAARAHAINLTGNQMAVLKYPVDGSSLNTATDQFGESDWDLAAAGNRDGDCWRGFQAALSNAVAGLEQQGLTPNFKGMIWWQGENGTSAAGLNTFIAGVRNHLANTYGLQNATEFPVVITGNDRWGTGLKSGVAAPDDYVGFVNSDAFGQAGNVHVGSDEGPSDWDSNGTNDMFEIGAAYADEMAQVLAGNNGGGTDPVDVVVWDGEAGDGLWNSAANWSGDALPVLGDTIAITNGDTVNMPGNDWSLPADITVNVSGSSQIGNTVAAARLYGSMTFNFAAGSGMSGAYIDLYDGTLNFENGATFTPGFIQHRGSTTYGITFGETGFSSLTPGTLTTGDLGENWSNVTFNIDFSNYDIANGNTVDLIDYSGHSAIYSGTFNPTVNTDEGSSGLTGTLSFDTATSKVIYTFEAPVTAPVLTLNSGFPPVVEWSAVSGQTYNVWFKTNLTDSVWIDLGPATDRFTMPTNDASGFIRIEAGP